MFSRFVGGVMIDVGGALRDANVNLSTVFQFSAAGLVIAALALLLMKPSRTAEESASGR